MVKLFILMKVQCPVNAYYQRLDYYFSVVWALQNIKNFVHLLVNKSLLKVCNDEAATAQFCCFSFFSTNFELTHVQLFHIIFYGSLYANSLPKVIGEGIIAVSFSATLSFFWQNLELILVSYSHLYNNILAILFVYRHLKWAFKTISQYCLYCDVVFYTYFEHVPSSQCVSCVLIDS